MRLAKLHALLTGLPCLLDPRASGERPMWVTPAFDQQRMDNMERVMARMRDVGILPPPGQVRARTRALCCWLLGIITVLLCVLDQGTVLLAAGWGVVCKGVGQGSLCCGRLAAEQGEAREGQAGGAQQLLRQGAPHHEKPFTIKLL